MPASLSDSEVFQTQGACPSLSVPLTSCASGLGCVIWPHVVQRASLSANVEQQNVTSEGRLACIPGEKEERNKSISSAKQKEIKTAPKMDLEFLLQNNTASYW